MPKTTAVPTDEAVAAIPLVREYMPAKKQQRLVFHPRADGGLIVEVRDDRWVYMLFAITPAGSPEPDSIVTYPMRGKRSSVEDGQLPWHLFNWPLSPYEVVEAETGTNWLDQYEADLAAFDASVDADS